MTLREWIDVLAPNCKAKPILNRLIQAKDLAGLRKYALKMNIPLDLLNTFVRQYYVEGSEPKGNV